MELWSGRVWVEEEPGSFSEVDRCVWCLWEMVIVFEAVLDVKL